MMALALMMVLALAALLIAASVHDIQTQRIPNGLIVFGLAVGIGGHACANGGLGLLFALGGIGTALILLLPYALGILGAGDVKLCGAVGALMGPGFLLWTLLGTVFAGAVLALLWAARRGVLRETLVNVRLGLFLWNARAGVSALTAHSSAGRMPFAPAIALGAVFARVHLGLFLGTGQHL